MATALLSSCEEKQSNNLDEYSDDSGAESEKVRKAKKSKKPGNEKWAGSLICNLIDEYEAQAIRILSSTFKRIRSYGPLFYSSGN